MSSESHTTKKSAQPYKITMSFSSPPIHPTRPSSTLLNGIITTSRVGLRASVRVRCESKEQLNGEEKLPKLGIGSPIIVTEAPKMVKTAASVPCLRVNAGLINPGDVGRIVSRKPMDVWAVRLSVGTYLIDGKYFKPLEINDK